MVLNTEKTKIMLITTRQKRLYVNENNLTLSYNNIDLQVTSVIKFLACTLIKICNGIITTRPFVKKYPLIFGFCLRYVIF